MSAILGRLPAPTTASSALWLHLLAAAGLAGACLAAWLGAGGKRGDRPRRIAWWSFWLSVASGVYLMPASLRPARLQLRSLAVLEHAWSTAYGSAMAWKLILTLALALGMAFLWRRAAAVNLLLVAGVLGCAALLAGLR